MTYDIILESIDEINIASRNTEVSVIESMVSLIEKCNIISEYKENDDCSSFSIFQEGILDDVKKMGKDDSALKKILLFIPRLIKALIDSLKPSKKTKNKMKNATTFALKTGKLSKRDKEAKCKVLNACFNGKAECYVDEKTGKIKFKKDKSQIISELVLHVSMALSIHNLIKRVKAHLDVLNPSSVQSFITQCDDILNNRTPIENGRDIYYVCNGGLSALTELLKDFFSASGALTLALAEIQTMVDNMNRKNLIKDVPNEKKHEILQKTTMLVDRITKIQASVTAATGAVSFIIDILGVADEYVGKQVKVGDVIESIADLLDKETCPRRPKVVRKENESDDSLDTRYTKELIDLADKIYKESLKEYVNWLKANRHSTLEEREQKKYEIGVKQQLLGPDDDPRKKKNKNNNDDSTSSND